MNLKAIKHAHEIYKVDIITMAFGYPRGERNVNLDAYDAMEQAIANAVAAKVLVFAAASNRGSLDAVSVAYPAGETSVICIHACKALSRRSEFTAGMDTQKMNFAVIGEDVLSAWPVHKGSGIGGNKAPKKRKSGTSTSVTIAASIAGLILQLVRLPKPAEQDLPLRTLERVRDRLKTFGGMCRILEKMSQKVDGYYCITPWPVIDLHSSNYSSSPEKARVEIIKEITKHLALYYPIPSR